jgi:hypothetical protein
MAWDHLGLKSLGQLPAVPPGDFRQGEPLLAGQIMQLPAAQGAIQIADKPFIELPPPEATVAQGADLGLFRLTHCQTLY